MKECDLNTSEQGRSSLIFLFLFECCWLCYLFPLLSHDFSLRFVCCLFFFLFDIRSSSHSVQCVLTSAIVCLWVNVPIFLVIFVVCFFPSIKIHCMQRKLLLAITNGHLGTHTFAIYCLRIVKVPIVLVFSIRCNIERQFTKPIE